MGNPNTHWTSLSTQWDPFKSLTSPTELDVFYGFQVFVFQTPFKTNSRPVVPSVDISS